VKGVYAVGTASQFILAWRLGWGPGSDAAYLFKGGMRGGEYRKKALDFGSLSESLRRKTEAGND